MVLETCSSAQEIESKGSWKEGFGRMADSSRLCGRIQEEEKKRGIGVGFKYSGTEGCECSAWVILDG